MKILECRRKNCVVVWKIGRLGKVLEEMTKTLGCLPSKKEIAFSQGQGGTCPYRGKGDYLEVEKGVVLAHSQRHMKRFAVLFLAAALLTGSFGCRPSATSAPPAGTNAPAKPKGTPQAKLPTIKLDVGGKEMITEIAADDRARQMGMMFREKMGKDEGMIFIFPTPIRASFWMKNTFVPLDAAYIDSRGVILEIHKLMPLKEDSAVASSDQVQYVLETPQGWFERNGVKVGALIVTEHGPLAKVLKTNR